MTYIPWLTSVAAYGLDSSAHLPEAALPTDEWTTFLRAVIVHRLSGLLISAIDAGRFPATEGQREEAMSVQVDAMHLALLLEAALLELDERFTEVEVVYRLLKGPSFAHLLYPDPSLRPFGDIDLLVAGDDFARAGSVIAGLGGSRPSPELSPGFDRRFSKGATFSLRSGLELDLHRTFVFGPFGFRMVAEDLFATSAHIELAGRRLPTLGREERFVHACYHAALGSPAPRLLTVRDVGQGLLDGGLDSDRAKELTARWQGQAVLAAAIRLACDTLEIAPAVPLVEWAGRYQIGRRDRRALSVYRSGGSYLAQAAASVTSIPGLRAKADFVTSLATAPVTRHPRRSGRCRRLADMARIVMPRASE